jgi:hypothetical protein
MEFEDNITKLIKSAIKNVLVILSDKNDIILIRFEINKRDNSVNICEIGSSKCPKLD